MSSKTKKIFFGCLLLLFATLATAQAPSANFTAQVTSGCSPLVVNFSDLSTGRPTSWFWDFGNGATSTLQNPSTTYFKEGSYTVTLTVANAAGKNTLTRTAFIKIYGKPAANFFTSDSVGCFPLRSQFRDASIPAAGTTNTTWFWDFGDGTQSTQKNPYHVYTASGNYTVTFKVTNDKGCFSVVSKPEYININGGVKAAFTNTPLSVCQPPFPVAFTNTSEGPGILTWFWSFGDGSNATVANPSHQYTKPGNYTVTLITSSSNGCTDTLVKSNLFNITENKTQFAVPDSVCVNTPATFNNTATPAPVSAVWKFDDGTTSTSINAQKVFTTPGSHTIKLYNTYSYCTDSTAKTIEVVAGPKAAFAADQQYTCKPPLQVNFTNNSAGAVSWLWDFGDGTTSTSKNPQHVYTTYGSYNVRLIATNRFGCSDTIQSQSFINIKKPEVFLPGLPVEGCIPYTIHLNANVNTLDAVTSYLWDFGNGVTSTAQQPSHTYTTEGVYNITLTITTSTGCTETVSLNNAVMVGRHPTAAFTAVPNPVCAFKQVQFINETDYSDTWLWNFGDGTTSSEKNPLHQYSDTGMLNVRLIVKNMGCPDTLEKEKFIHINPPIAKFGYTANCNNKLQMNFTDSSVGAKSFFWDFGDGSTSTEQNPQHVFSSYNTYQVTLTVTNDTCSHSVTHPVKVFDDPLNFKASDTVVCRRSTIYFNAITPAPGNITNYLWEFGDNASWNSDNYDKTGAAYHYYGLAGNYTVQLTTTDIYGCKKTITKPKYIAVNGPTAAIQAANVNGCAALTAQFTDASQTDGVNPITSWRWNFGDGAVQTLFTGSVQHTYAQAGTYNVSLLITDAAGCADSVSLPELVHATKPVASFTSDTLSCPQSPVQFNNTSNAINFTSHWSFGDGLTSTVTNAAHAYADTGLYTVRLKITDQYNCSDSISKPAYIHINRPVASFTVSDSVSFCAPFQVQFTNTSTYYNAFDWQLGKGTSSQQNPVQYYLNSGAYQIQLAVKSPGGCTDTAYKTIRVFDTVGTYIRYQPLEGCKPLSVDLNTFSKGPVTYTWDFGDGVLLHSTVDTVNHVYNYFGDFVPKIIMTDPSGCIIPIAGADTIRIAGATAKFGVNSYLLCDSGQVALLDSTSFNDSIINYHWNFGDGQTSSLQNPGTHYYQQPGVYTISLTLQTEQGCVDTFLLNTPLKVVQSPIIAVAGDSVICLNEYMEHVGVFLRQDTSAVQWKWRFPNGGVADVQLPALQQYTNAGSFVVSAIATNSSGCADTVLKNVLIHPLPQVTMPPVLTKIAGSPITIPATYTNNVTSYNWVPNNTLSCATCPQPETNTKFDTRYVVSFMDSNGCKNSGNILIDVVCKNANVFIPNTFSPNGDGSNDVLYVRGRGLERVKTLRIFNRWGEVVFEKSNFPVNDVQFGWDGKYKGKKALPDVYVYQVAVFCENNDTISFEGNVALIQ